MRLSQERSHLPPRLCLAMAYADLVVTLMNGDTLSVQRDPNTQISQICAELEQALRVQGLMEIKLISGSTILSDPLPDKIDSVIQGVISPSPTKALSAILLYMETIHRTLEPAGPSGIPSPPREEDSWEGASESSSDYGYMALINPYVKSDVAAYVDTPMASLSPEAEACGKALMIIEENFESLTDLQEVTLALLDLSELQGDKLDKLPISLELSIKGIQILLSNIHRPGMVGQVKEFMHNGFYDVVRLACASTRKHADTWLTVFAELMAATHCSTPSVRYSLCRIISSCPAPIVRMAATKALAELAFAKHERDIAIVGEEDTNDEVRRTAQVIHEEGMKSFAEALNDQW